MRSHRSLTLTARRLRRSPLKAMLFGFALLFPVVCIAGWWGYRTTKQLFSAPEAILVLGGDPRREVFAAQFARSHPELHIWVSGGSNPEYSEWVFAEAGIEDDRVTLDYKAIDTVTNFTTLVDKLQQENIDSLYLITSDYHMRRARIIGEIVLGSRGIVFRPVPMATGEADEPAIKSIRDGVRGLLWVTTGRTGSNFRQVLEKVKTHRLRGKSDRDRISGDLDGRSEMTITKEATLPLD